MLVELEYEVKAGLRAAGGFWETEGNQLEWDSISDRKLPIRRTDDRSETFGI